jgi:hypothetical protein
MKTELMSTDEVSVREVSQCAMDHAPCITFGQFRLVAKQREWSLAFLHETVRAEIERPTETLTRILRSGPRETVIPYTVLIELYHKATRPKPALAGEKSCGCGCGGQLRGRQRYASPACRKRASRAAKNAA